LRYSNHEETIAYPDFRRSEGRRTAWWKKFHVHKWELGEHDNANGDLSKKKEGKELSPEHTQKIKAVGGKRSFTAFVGDLQRSSVWCWPRGPYQISVIFWLAGYSETGGEIRKKKKEWKKALKCKRAPNSEEGKPEKGRSRNKGTSPDASAGGEQENVEKSRKTYSKQLEDFGIKGVGSPLVQKRF